MVGGGVHKLTIQSEYSKITMQQCCIIPFIKEARMLLCTITAHIHNAYLGISLSKALKPGCYDNDTASFIKVMNHNVHNKYFFVY